MPLDRINFVLGRLFVLIVNRTHDGEDTHSEFTPPVTDPASLSFSPARRVANHRFLSSFRYSSCP